MVYLIKNCKPTKLGKEDTIYKMVTSEWDDSIKHFEKNGFYLTASILDDIGMAYANETRLFSNENDEHLIEYSINDSHVYYMCFENSPELISYLTKHRMKMT
ncbi:MAG: hypothetical protein KDK45_18075 [Leptospiraceae bacterium]|nr:hypothetical protein [Leptospiraceae bacterium]